MELNDELTLGCLQLFKPADGQLSTCTCSEDAVDRFCHWSFYRSPDGIQEMQQCTTRGMGEEGCSLINNSGEKKSFGGSNILISHNFNQVIIELCGRSKFSFGFTHIVD